MLFPYAIIDVLNPAIIHRMSNQFQYSPLQNSSYYTEEGGDNENLNAILTWYKNKYGRQHVNATFLFPIGGLRAIRHLSALASHHAFVRATLYTIYGTIKIFINRY